MTRALPTTITYLLATVLLATSCTGPNDHPDDQLSVSAHRSQGRRPSMVQGALTVLEVTDIGEGIGTHHYFVEDETSRRRFEIKFDREPRRRWKTGMKVRAHGRIEQEILFMGHDGASDMETIAYAGSDILTGEQKTIVILVNFRDAEVTCSQAQVEDLMFTNPDGYHVAEAYHEMSSDYIQFTGAVVGPYLIKHDVSEAACYSGVWESAALDAARAAGVKISDYNRHVFVYPTTTPCPGAGAGTIGGNPSRAYISYCGEHDLYAHELGHNLGMGHASTPEAVYGERADFMGIGTLKLMHTNGPHKAQLGWINGPQVQLITASGIYQIAPLEHGATDVVTPQILKFAKPDTGDDYFISYRQRIGFDQYTWDTDRDRAIIHTHGGGSRRTFMLDRLADGASYVDSTNNITVTQLSHDAEKSTVQVEFTHGNCTASTPNLEVLPPRQSGEAGSKLSYSVLVTNTDQSGCAAATFSLNTNVPSGWSGTASPTSLNLAPGDIGNATVYITSPSSEASGSYGFEVRTTDMVESKHNRIADVTYEVVPPPVACVRNAPVLALTPSDQTGNPGETLNYTATLTNGDTGDCGGSTFALSGLFPDGWSASVSPSALTLPSDSQSYATVTLKAPLNALAGEYGFSMTAVDSADASRVAQKPGSFFVFVDQEAPTAPTGLSFQAKQSHVSLSWTEANDNVAVTGYKIWRNGVMIAVTSWANYRDAAVDGGQNYIYEVSAYDGAQNQSLKSAPVSVSVRSRGRKK